MKLLGLNFFHTTMKNATGSFLPFDTFQKSLRCLIAVAFLFISTSISSQQWTPMGPDDYDQLSYGAASYISAAKGPGQTLFVTFQDQAYGSKAVGWKYENGQWTKLGSAISEGFARYTDIAVNSLGVPFVVYQDFTSGSKATVKKFTGGDWVAVGEVGFSVASVDYTRIAIGPDNTPYVVFDDDSEASRVTVKKFNGSAWVTVGVPGFSIGSVIWGTDIAVGADSLPIVVYTDFGLGLKATAKKFNGTAWVDAGNPGFSDGNAHDCQIALTSTNIPYVIFGDHAAGDKATVKRLSGATWSNVGPEGFSLGYISSPSIAIAPNNEVFVTYMEINSVRVKKYSAGQWLNVGDEDFVLATGGDQNLSLVAMGNNQLCLAFANWKANVACFDSNTWTTSKSSGIIPENAEFPQLTLSNFVVPYLTFPYFTITYMPVLTYSPPLWIYLPPTPEYNYDLLYPSLDAAPSGTLYTAYVDQIDFDSSDIRVNYFDGLIWKTLSSDGLDNGRFINDFDFKLDKTGVPYVVYDIDYNLFAVSRYNGSEWEPVGNVFPADVSYLELAFSDNNTPYLAYREYHTGVTVKKFTGAGWETVGTEAFITSYGNYNICKNCINLSVAGDSTPYLLYSSASDVIRLIQYDGVDWKQIGDSMKADPGNQFVLAVAGNTPYVLYEDPDIKRGLVKKWNGYKWITLGGEPFSAGTVTALQSYPDMAVSGNRKVFVAYDNYTLYAKSFDDVCTAPVNILGPDTVLVNQTVAFDAPAGFTSYTWDAGAGVVSGGQGTPHAQITFPASGLTTVRITATDSDGCSGTATQAVFVPGAVSTTPPPLPVSIRIGSNPFGDFLRFELYPPGGSVRHIRITDALGHIWWEQTAAPAGAFYIDTASWPPGAYFLYVEAGGTSAVRRLVKV